MLRVSTWRVCSLVLNGGTAPSCGLKSNGTKGNRTFSSLGRDATPVVAEADFVKGWSLGRKESIVFCCRNNGMPEKGTIEKTQDTMQSFLWMPAITEPIGDILTSLFSTAKAITGVLIGGFVILTYYGFVKEARAAGNTLGFSLVAPAVGMAVGGAILMLFILMFGAWFTPLNIGGFNIFTMYPNTCPPDHPELDGALCYKACPANRHRVGDVCWADTHQNGMGTPIGLEPCPDGWNNWGLVCQNPIRCDPIDTSKMPWTGGQCHGGELVGRLDHGGVCPGPEDAGSLDGFDAWYKKWSGLNGKKPRSKKKTCTEAPNAHSGERSCQEEDFVKAAKHTERVDGMCYKPCPDGMVHVPLMPYLCVKKEADGKPMRLDYYDADSKVPSMIQLFGRFNPF